MQDHKHAAVAAARGVAVREVPVGNGRADYVLFVDCQAVGVIEAKPVGTTLTGVEPQTLGYRKSYPGELPAFGVGGVLPFGYESTGVETRFTCGLDPLPTSRRVFAFHRPETLARWVEDRFETEIGTLRAGLTLLPDLDPRGLWPAQAEAICSLEASLRNNRSRALIKMATGSGKTFTAVSAAYRLVRHAGAQRVLFLVDRANLGRQAVREFEGFDTPDDGRKFTELYNVRRLTSSHLDMAAEGATKVHVSTIQRLFSLLQGEELDDALDEQSGFEMAPEQPVEVVYNPAVPIESYDMIIVDECHRSIYGAWRQVLEYFDAFLVGLTATPGIQTAAFFEQNLVTDYGHAEAVADRVNVDFDVFRIRTEITEGGGTVPAGFVTEFRDRLTRSQRIDRVDEDVDYDAAELDRRVVTPDQIRTIVATLRNSLPEMFPDRERRADGRLEHIPKTLIFAKDDSHADDIVQTVRKEFDLGNEGAVKITYRSGDAGHRPEDLLQQFRNAYNPRIAVTVDLIATGTDVKPIECVVFMRRVRSRNYFEQNRDQITALQVLYSQPRGGDLTYADIRELANAIARPPHRWTAEALWTAYETLDASRVRGSSHRVNTDLVSLVRYALGLTDELVAYPNLVNERFETWLQQQRNAGREMTDDQIAYLRLIRDHLATSLMIAPHDFRNPPFSTHGGYGRARQLFGAELTPLMDELIAVLVA